MRLPAETDTPEPLDDALVEAEGDLAEEPDASEVAED
jgi:hypothetical protein